MKKILSRFALAVSALVLATQLAHAAGKTHHVAMHIDENDPALMNLVLNNAANVTSYYKSQGDEVIVEIVAYGPGLNMFIPGKSPVEQRISAMALEMPNVSYAACGNTLKKMSEKAGKDVQVMTESHVVTSGVVRLIELQEDGYAYVRP